MTEALEAMGDSLYNNLVPLEWEVVSYPSLMPLAAWNNDLIKRVGFLQHWADNGIPIVFWISGFFFPQAFLTGTLQNFARKTRKAIDAISFDFHILDKPIDELVTPPKVGVYIKGLFMEGAQWDPHQCSILEFDD